MKKALIIVCVLACLLGLIGCDPATNNMDASELLANTVKIELVYYENENPQSFRLDNKNKPIFNFNKVTIIGALDDSRFEDIIMDIAEHDFLFWGNDLVLNEPNGKTLILYQSNGNIVVLYNWVYTNEKGLTYYYGDCSIFDENGLLVEYIGSVSNGWIDSLESAYFSSNP